MGEPAIAIRALDKYFGDFHALKCIAMGVAASETLVICGPSGSGNSTLVRCINGLEGYSSGDLRVLGMEVGDDTCVLDRVRKRVEMVIQNFNLFPHLTVLENCILPQQRALGRDRSSARDEAMNQLAKMRVAMHADKYPDQISGGQQQRVALARALCLTPEQMFTAPRNEINRALMQAVQS